MPTLLSEATPTRDLLTRVRTLATDEPHSRASTTANVSDQVTQAAADAVGPAPSPADLRGLVLGSLDGATGTLRGRPFDPFTEGLLKKSHTLEDIADLLIHGRKQPARCAMTGCTNREHRMGTYWCGDHDPTPAKQQDTCTECTDAADHGPWCKAHHSNWFYRGVPDGDRTVSVACLLPTCTNSWAWRGLCKDHKDEFKQRDALDVGMTARTRALLRRHAVLSCLVSSDPREILRACARWLRAVEGVRDETEQGTAAHARAEREQQFAMEAIWTNGGARLAQAQANKWKHPGTLTEGGDIEQGAALGLLACTARYNPDEAPLSSFAHFAINDFIGQQVKFHEHPHLPRNGMKYRGRIHKLQAKLEEMGLPTSDAEACEWIAAQLQGVTPQVVNAVLNEATQVPLNGRTHGDGAADDGPSSEFIDLLADTDPDLADELGRQDQLGRTGALIDMHLTDQELDILTRYLGLGGCTAEDLTAIGESYDRSRTWAGSRLKKALAKLQHPASMFGLSDDVTPVDPSELAEQMGLPTGHVWLDRLTERQQYVARNVLGVAGQHLPGTVTERLTTVADALQVTVAEATFVMYEVLTAAPDTENVPAVPVDRYREAALATVAAVAERAREWSCTAMAAWDAPAAMVYSVWDADPERRVVRAGMDKAVVATSDAEQAVTNAEQAAEQARTAKHAAWAWANPTAATARAEKAAERAAALTGQLFDPSTVSVHTTDPVEAARTAITLEQTARSEARIAKQHATVALQIAREAKGVRRGTAADRGRGTRTKVS